jgi:hypothetical protein
MRRTPQRELKEIPFLRGEISNPTRLLELCYEHNVKIVHDEDHLSLVLTEVSIDLPGLARKIADCGLIDKMNESKRGAYLHDISTLDCL